MGGACRRRYRVNEVINQVRRGEVLTLLVGEQLDLAEYLLLLVVGLVRPVVVVGDRDQDQAFEIVRSQNHDVLRFCRTVTSTHSIWELYKASTSPSKCIWIPQ